MKTKATANIILDPVSKAEKRVLKLQVTFNRVSDRKSLGGTLKISVDDYQKQNKAYKDAFEEVRTKYQKACDIIAYLGEDFTFEQFREAWKNEAWAKKKGIGKYSNKMITDLYDEYYTSKFFSPATKALNYILVKWIEEYKPRTKLNDITIDFLNDLGNFIKEESHKRRGIETSDITIGIYMRGLKAVFNYAIDKQYITQDKYPFGKNKYKLASKTSANIALSEEEFQLFVQADPQDYKERLGYYFFLLSYALDGLNLADIIRIKNRDIVDNTLFVGRWKTRNALSNQHLEEKELLPSIIDIFNEYGVINPSEPNKYILRFLWDVDDDDIELQDKKKKNLNKNINKGIKKLCKRIGITPVTFYSARHTYATDSINDNMSIAVLSRNLLHKNINTTQGYIDSISNANKKKNIDLKAAKLEKFNVK